MCWPARGQRQEQGREGSASHLSELLRHSFATRSPDGRLLVSDRQGSSTMLSGHHLDIPQSQPETKGERVYEVEVVELPCRREARLMAFGVNPSE